MFDLRQNYGGGNPSKGPMHKLPHSMPLTLQQAASNPHLPWRLWDTQRQVWVSLLWGSLLLSPGSWYTPGFVCALKESVSPVLCRFYNQIPLQSQITWGFSVPLPDPQVGESVVGPRTFLTVQECLWYYCFAVCGSSAVGSAMVGLMATFSKRAYATGCVTRSPATRAPAPAAGHC